jgi:hypothetical protein
VITAERLRQVLKYDPQTGAFTRLIARAGHPIGSVAGYIDGSGHRQMSVDWKVYLAHRLAWLYMTGEWPKAQIDHKNCNPDDNRWENLREATHTENARNKRLNRNNRSGHKGVYWHSQNRKWVAQLGRLRLGSFGDKESAAAAYAKAAAERFGEFARVA